MVGVGPHPQPWPADDRFDPELLEHGDTRNVVDQYRYWTVEAIVEDLNLRRHSLHVAIENWQNDFNIGAIVRNANAFNVAAVHIIGKKRWNRRGAMVTDRYLSIENHPDIAAFVGWTAGEELPVIGIDNIDGSEPIEGTPLPRKCVMVFGQEGPGLSDEIVSVCQKVLAITQFGSTRSVNLGVASGIAMYTWALQHAGPSPTEGRE